MPARPAHESAPPHDRAARGRRRYIENLWAGPEKERRAVAARYEKTAASHLGDLRPAAFEGPSVP